MGGHLIQCDAFQIGVRLIENSSCRCFINASALHADQSVFHQIEKTDAVLSADFIELENHFLEAHRFAIERYRLALFEVDFDFCRLIRRLHRGNAHFQEARLVICRHVGGIFKVKSLVAQMPHVLVLGIVCLSGNLQRNVVSLRIVDFLIS